MYDKMSAVRGRTDATGRNLAREPGRYLHLHRDRSGDPRSTDQRANHTDRSFTYANTPKPSSF